MHNFSGDFGIEKPSREEIEEVLKELDENGDGVSHWKNSKY